MKKIELKKGRVIETPWLRIEEAAAYCGLARSTFLERVNRLPHGGDENLRLYNCRVLDLFLAGDYPDVPFGGGPAPTPARRRRSRSAADSRQLVDPVTGEIHRPPGRPVAAAQ